QRDDGANKRRHLVAELPPVLIVGPGGQGQAAGGNSGAGKTGAGKRSSCHECASPENGTGRGRSMKFVPAPKRPVQRSSGHPKLQSRSLGPLAAILPDAAGGVKAFSLLRQRYRSAATHGPSQGRATARRRRGPRPDTDVRPSGCGGAPSTGQQPNS